MTSIKIGILREGKIPIDRRVPFTPAQTQEIHHKFTDITIACQPSAIRCFPDNEYEKQGTPLQEELQDCDVLMGVKEVPIENLIPNKTYFFFSHTIKAQAYNRDLLKAALAKNIRLIDYEVLKDANNTRIVAFGRYAGIVGAYNGLWTFGKRYNLFHLRRARDCFDMEDLKTEFSKVKLPPIKIGITGGGRVAKGAMEVLHGIGLQRVSPSDFIHENYKEPVFTLLNTKDYNRKKDGGAFRKQEFYQQPERYESDFHPYAQKMDLLIAAAYWDPKAPVLFHQEDVLQNDFNIKVIADITCDIEGSIPSTKKPSTIDDPVYDYEPSEDTIEPAFSDEGNITVMAVDNLPCELPRDASNDFGRELIDNVLPNLVGEDTDAILARATIAENGRLTSYFSYLQGFVDGA